MIYPPDPLNRDSVIDVMGYLSHGRMGDDPEEDAYYIAFMKKAYCHFVGVERVQVSWAGRDDYDVLMDLCKLVAIALGTRFETNAEVLGKMGVANARWLDAQEHKAAEAILKQPG